MLPEHTLTTGVPEGLRYAALWMVKRRKDSPTWLPRHTPVAIMVTPLASGTGLATVVGWDPKRAQWIPYPQFLLRLVKIAEIPDIVDDDLDDDTPGNDAVLTAPRDGQNGEVSPGSRRRVTYRAWKQNMDEQRKATERYLQKMLRSLRGHPTALLTHSQNSRMHWPWLQDSRTEQDLIKTGHAPPSHLDPDLRLIRVRSATGRETPQWWGNSPPGGVTPATRDVDRDRRRRIHFRPYLLQHHRQSGIFRDSAVEADKLAPRPLRQGPNKGEPTIDAHIPAWNPTLVEIAVVGCHPEAGDKPEALALAVHQSRQAPDYLDALSTPLPMDLASLAQAYVLPPGPKKTKMPKKTRPTRQGRLPAAQLKRTWPQRSASSPGPPWRTKLTSTPSFPTRRAWPKARRSPSASARDKRPRWHALSPGVTTCAGEFAVSEVPDRATRRDPDK